MSHWANGYVTMRHCEIDGLVKSGAWHCWALAVLVYRQEIGIVLPSYAGRFTSLEEQAEIAALVDEERNEAVWGRTDSPCTFDLALFRQGRMETHIGIVVKPGLMLHVTLDDHQPKLEQYETGRWRHRLAGFYRHAQAVARSAA